jgi:hypothetical protein
VRCFWARVIGVIEVGYPLPSSMPSNLENMKGMEEMKNSNNRYKRIQFN